MNHQKSELYFLLVLIAGIFVLTFLIFKPFFYSLILAIVFATVFSPLHKKMLVLTLNRKNLGALLAIITVLIVVIIPFAVLGIQILQEATQLYSSLVSNGSSNDLYRGLDYITRRLIGFSPVSIEFSLDVNQYLKQGLSWILQHLDSLFANLAKAITGIFIFLVALYFLFRDGQKLKETIIALSPLQDIHDETIFDKLALATNSVIKGSLLVAFIQGVLTAVGFALFGVPNPVLWGSVTVIAALIPGIGTAMVLLPAIFYLYFSGDASGVFYAIGLLLWGIAAVGLVDNFLGPKFVERGMRLHPFLILLSILGGIGFFGPLGFLLGPLVLSLLSALLEIYFAIRKEHTDKLN